MQCKVVKASGQIWKDLPAEKHLHVFYSSKQNEVGFVEANRNTVLLVTFDFRDFQDFHDH